jgi:hypothetical protein
MPIELKILDLSPQQAVMPHQSFVTLAIRSSNVSNAVRKLSIKTRILNHSRSK